MNQKGQVADRILFTLTVLLFLVGLGTVGYVYFGAKLLKKKPVKIVEQGDCVSQKLNQNMEDEWLDGMLEKGRPFTVLKGFYDCNEPQRGDLVWFRPTITMEPVVRIVRGIPGDSFEIVQDTSDKTKWFVKIDGNWMKAKDGRLVITSEHIPALRTYEISRQGKLRQGDYIVLSNVSPGLSDSTNLGLVRRRSFEGKVVTK